MMRVQEKTPATETMQAQDTTPVTNTIPMQAVALTVDPGLLDFIEANADSIFPTPTQEALELMVDSELLNFIEANADSIFPTPTQEALELMVQTPKASVLTADTPVGRAALGELSEDALNNASPPKLCDDDDDLGIQNNIKVNNKREGWKRHR